MAVSVGNASPSVHSTRLGVSGDLSAPANAVTTGTTATFDTKPADNLTATITTLTTNNNNPALKQSFTLSGTLKAGTTPLSGKSITLYRIDPSGGSRVVIGTTTTTNGAYTFTRSESVQGVTTYQAVFAGDTTYTSSSASVKVDV